MKTLIWTRVKEVRGWMLSTILLICGVMSAHAVPPAPTFSPTGGASARNLNVAITCPSGTIYYTTNGATPTVSDATITSGGTVLVGRKLTLKAASKDGSGFGPVTTVEYDVTGMVAAGASQGLALKPNGKVYAWGLQTGGQLGTGTNAAGNISTAVPMLKASATPFDTAVFVVGGVGVTMAIDDAGKLWATGSNGSAQLGQGGSAAGTGFPVKVLKGASTDLTNVKDADGGDRFGVALDTSGTVWTWGYRANGRLGNGQTSGTTSYATAITVGGTMGDVAAGESFCLALDKVAKTVKSWGNNASGQLGDGTTVAKSSPVTVLTTTGTLSNVEAVDAGEDFSLALVVNGGARTVWSWGNQADGRLGNNTNTVTAVDIKNPTQVLTGSSTGLTNVVQIAAGPSHSLALDTSGYVWSWGQNTSGQLGDGTVTSRGLAAKVKTTDGNYLKDVVSIAAGGMGDNGYSLALGADGTLHAWGFNTNGQLATGTTGAATSQKFATPAAKDSDFGNEAPTVTLNVSDTKLLAPTVLSIDGTATDDDGTVAQVKLYSITASGTTLLTTVNNNANFSHSLNVSTSGTYTIRAEAADIYGNVKKEDKVVQIELPVVAIEALNEAVYEGGSAGKMRLYVTNGNLYQNLSVTLDIAGTAQAGVDYYAITSPQTIGTTNSVEFDVTPKTNAAKATDSKVVVTVVDQASYSRGEISTASMAIQKIATPKFTYNSARAVRAFDVTVACATAGVTIRYTTDGREPTTSDPSIASGSTINIGANLTLKAKAWGTGGRVSAVAEQSFQVTGMVAAGSESAIGILVNGNAKSWGSQYRGQLSNGAVSTGTISTPTVVKTDVSSTLSGAKYAAGGVQFNIILDSNKYVWSFGLNSSAQLGRNSSATELGYAGKVLKSATPDDYLANIGDIAAGDLFAVAVEETSGNVWSWGIETGGRLGTGVPGTAKKQWAQPVVTATNGAQLSGIKQVETGTAFAIARGGANGKLWSWGTNTYGQLGTGTTTGTNRAVQVKKDATTDFQDTINIAAGDDFALAVVSNDTEDRSVWSWGNQLSGRLGNAVLTSGTITYPVAVKRVDGTSLDQIVQLSAGSQHSLALDENGNVWSWGVNTVGQLGDGTTTARALADRVKLPDGSYLSNVVYVAAGGTGANGFSVALKADGTTYSWGYNTAGQLANGTIVAASYATPTVSGFNLANQTPIATVSVSPSSPLSPADLVINASATDADGTVQKIEIYNGSTLLASQNGSSKTYNWSDVPAGDYQVKVIAYDDKGMQGTTSTAVHVAKPKIVVTALTEDIQEDSVTNGVFRVSLENGTLSDPLDFTFLLGGTAVSGTDYESVTTSATIPASNAYVDIVIDPKVNAARNTDATLTLTLAAGSNHEVSVPAAATMLLRKSPKVATPQFSRAGGSARSNIDVIVSCATAGASIHYTTNGKIPTLDDPTIVSSGTLSIGTNLVLKARAWDENGNSSAIAEATYWITGMISAGSHSVLGVAANGEIYAWGWQRNGQLGNGNTSTTGVLSPASIRPNAMKFASVSAGTEFGLAINVYGFIHSFGENADGQLGFGDTTDHPYLTDSGIISLSGTMAQVSGGEAMSLAVSSSGKVWSWGAQANGRLGNGSSTAADIDEPVQVMTETSPGVYGQLSGITQVDAGVKFGLARGSSGEIWAWGDNAFGQLAQGGTAMQVRAVKVKRNSSPSNYLANVQDISAGNGFSLAVVKSGSENGLVYSWGNRDSGRLGHSGTAAGYVDYPACVLTASGTLQNIVQVSAGYLHAMALDKDGNVWTWGDNRNGQLGDNTTTDRAVAAQVALPGGKKAAYVSAGGGAVSSTLTAFSAVLCEDGSICSWGYGGHGELGNGSTSDSGVPVVTGTLNLGNQLPVIYWSLGEPETHIPGDITLNVSATDPDGTIAKVELYNGADLLSPNTIAGSVVWKNVAPGTYYLTAIAYDNDGGKTVETRPLVINVPEEDPVSKLYARTNFGGFSKSFVIPLDYQTGTKLAELGNNDAIYPTDKPFLFRDSGVSRPTVLIVDHIPGGARFPAYRSVKNPIIAFGKEAKGSPLYAGKVYRFAVSAGKFFRWPHPETIPLQNAEFYPLRVEYFNNSTGAKVGETKFRISIPGLNVGSPPPNTQFVTWNVLAKQNFKYSYKDAATGIETTIQHIFFGSTWNVGNDNACIVSHKADDSNYSIVVSQQGVFPLGMYWFPVAANSAITPFLPPPYPPYTEVSPYTIDDWYNNDNVDEFTTYQPLYSCSFDKALSWRIEGMDHPYFEGNPMPAAYVGKSAPELLNRHLGQINLSIETPGDYLALNTSPELRTFKELDDFIAGLTGGLSAEQKAMAVANYVLNEVKLEDAWGYPDVGDTLPSMSEVAIYGPGMKRNAYSTYLEGAGSPAEQCALTVYMLRKIGIPAAYVFPERSKMKILDARLSKIFGMQIRGAMDKNGGMQNDGVNSSQPSLIPVNWPFVAAHIGGNWVNIYPWMKDVEIREGLDVWDLLPSGFDYGLGWVEKYLKKDSELVSFDDDKKTPAQVFVAQADKLARDLDKGLTIDDYGIKIRYRKKNYSSWSEFPTPFEITGTARAVKVMADEPDIFDTFKIKVTSNYSSKNITTPEIPLMEALNRRIFLKFEDDNKLYLNMSRVDNSTSVNQFANSFSTLGTEQEKSVAITITTDKAFSVETTFYNDRRFWKAFHALDGEVPDTGFTTYLGLSEKEESVTKTTLGIGDLAAICINPGRVSTRQIEPIMREYLAAQEAVKINPDLAEEKSDVLLGGLVQLLGMSYHQRCTASTDLLSRLHKGVITHRMTSGLALMVAKKDENGLLPNNQIDLVQPKLDMSCFSYGMIGAHNARPDSFPRDPVPITDNLTALWFTEHSALEHVAIDRFFDESAAISTVKLLRLSNSLPYAGIKEPTRVNYSGTGSPFLEYFPPGTPERTFFDANINPELNTDEGYATKIYVTPGKVTGAKGAYTGVGALIFTEKSASALISSEVMSPIPANGGAGAYFTNATGQAKVSLSNASQFQMSWGPDGSAYFKVGGNSGNGGSGALTMTTWNVSTSGFGDFYYNSTNSNSYVSVDQARWGYTNANMLKLENDIKLSASHSGGLAEIFEAVLDYGSMGMEHSWLAVGFNYVFDPVNVMTGSFYIDNTDLTLPGPMDVELRRNYLSDSQMLGALGYGWKTSMVPYLVVAKDNKTIYAAEKDGSVIAYSKEADRNVWKPYAECNAGMVNVNGLTMGGMFNPFNNSIEKTTQNGATVYVLKQADGGKRTFRVRSFPLSYTVGEEGEEERITIKRERPYLEKWEDNRGNSLNFSFGEGIGLPEYGELTRIVSSNGNFMGFNYDSFRHMVEAYTGDGRRVSYNYDDDGDLTSVTLADGSEIKYEYEVDATTNTSTHRLKREIKPEGRIVENVYDSEGRIGSQKATVGENDALVTNATFVYNNTKDPVDGSLTGYTTVTNALGKTTRYDYASSRLEKVTDPIPLSYVMEQHWHGPYPTAEGSAPLSLEYTIDRRGLRTDFKYDAQGNVTEKKLTGDLKGDGSTTTTATETRTYNGRNLLTEQMNATEVGTDKLRTEYKYESTVQPWLPTRILNYAGGTLIDETQYRYVNVGDSATGAFGLVSEMKKAAGTADEAVTTYTYSANGWLTSETKKTGTSDPAIVRNLRYNLRGEMVEDKDAIGRTTSLAYDGMGRMIWQETSDENGLLIGWDYRYYNQNGQLEWRDGPRYYPEDYVYTKYDGGGRPKEKLVWRSQARTDGLGVTEVSGASLEDSFAITTFKHDAFGNMTDILDPRLNLTEVKHDSLGRVTEKLVYSGSTNSAALLVQENFAYEPGDEVSKKTDIHGGVTDLVYTDTGKLKKRTNPDGSIEQWRYDLYGRVEREILPNGSYRAFAYDDGDRTVTTTFHRADNTQLTTAAVQRDRRGNVVSFTDEKGAVFTTVYDALDRPKVTTGPAAAAGSGQQKLTYTYDASGKTVVAKNALGESVVSMQDALKRPLRTENRDAAGNLVRVNGFEYSPDHQAVTSVLGDGPSAYRTTVYTDTAGREVLVRKPGGNFTIKEYDAAGNLKLSMDETGAKTKFNDYDAANRLRKTVLPASEVTDDAGAEIGIEYTNSSKTIVTTMPGDRVHTLNLNSAGRPVTEVLEQEGTTTREFGYFYYESPDPEVGLLKTVTDPRSITFTHTYDDFLRKDTVVANGGDPEDDVTIGYEYDLAGRLLTVQQTYGSALIGPETQIDWIRDAYGNVTKETVKVDGSVQSEFTQAYDSARRRTNVAFTPTAQGSGAGRSYGFQYSADGLMKKISVSSADYSFGYSPQGLLDTRTAGTLTHVVDQRDTAGRPENVLIKNGSSVVFDQASSWRADSKMASYAWARPGSGLSEGERTYSYNRRGQLIEEANEYVGSTTEGWLYPFDTASSYTGEGLGVRMAAKRILDGSGPTDWEENSWGVEDTDVFGRPTDEGLYKPRNVLSNDTVSYDGAGNQLARQLGARAQAFTYDAFGRMVKATERDGSNNGFDFKAVYDGLGRRIRTVEQPVAAGSASGSAKTVDSYFDPGVEFLELGVSVNGTRAWKVYGPDLSGAYGGSQGIGGLLAVVQESSGAVASVLVDQFGTVQGRLESSTLTWNEVEHNAYGMVQGDVPALAVIGDLAEVTMWRGMRQDPTGLYWMGARYYDPAAGRFLSPDPMGHGASLSLYDYASGDPINFLDPDGRLASQAFGTVMEAGANFLGNRYVQGSMKVVGGSIEMVGGGAMIAAPDPTLLSKAGGVLVIAHGADTTQAGFKQLFGSGDGRTYTSMGISGWLQYGGMDQGRADMWGEIGDGGAGLLTGAGAIKAVDAFSDFSRVGNAAKTTPIIKCFPRGTKVETLTGQVCIEDIRQGDLVLSQDSEGQVVAREVVQLVRNQTAHWVEIRVDGETIKATGSHPFWEASKGIWLHARDLKSGMSLKTVNGTLCQIEAVTKVDLAVPEDTFNFEVAELHNYFAGTQKLTVLTHNTDPWEIAFSRDPSLIRASDVFDHGPLKGTTLGQAVSEAQTLGRLPNGLSLEGNWVNDLSHPRGGFYQAANNRTLWVAQEAGLANAGLKDTNAAFKTIQNHLKMPSGGTFLRLCPY